MNLLHNLTGTFGRRPCDIRGNDGVVLPHFKSGLERDQDAFIKRLVINPFDQWGVELGKEKAKALVADLVADAPTGAHDSSTAALVAWYRDRRRR